MTISIGDLGIDVGHRRVTFRDREIVLSPTEYRLLRELSEAPGVVHTHQMLLRAVWGDTHSDEAEYLHVYMGRLRRKIEPDPANPSYFRTLHGIGYMLNEP